MKKIIIANWKMQLKRGESLALLRKIANFSNIKQNLVICPDFLILSEAARILKKNRKNQIGLGAQNCASKKEGALTGEISPLNIKLAGADYVIIGHSERRRVFKENSSLINLKVKEALDSGLVPILCLGESLLEKISGRTRPVLSAQLKNALKSLKIKKVSDLIIAYEPVWAIGSGRPMVPEEADKIHKFIQDRAVKCFNRRFKIIYGGSVNSNNAFDFLKQKNISGLLVGGASLKASSLAALVKIK